MEFKVTNIYYDTYRVRLSDRTKKKIKKISKQVVVGAAIGYTVGCVIVAYNENQKKSKKK